jgi:hypothetical protein
MAELIPMRSVLVTDFGKYELPKSVADKIADYPMTKYWNPYSETMIEAKDLDHPPLKRYYRLVSEHMKREWLKG